MRLAVALLGICSSVVGCRTGAAPEPAAVAPEPNAAAVSASAVPPGFRAELIAAPVFGGEVFTLEGGAPTGPVVVLVHGLGDNGSRDFYPVLPALAAHHHVITFDLPGFGRSTHATELYSPERYAEFIRELVRARHTGPFNLVGHSMGGAISLTYAARFPADLERLFLIDAAGFLHRKAFVNFAVSAGLDNILGTFGGTGRELLDATLQAAAIAVGPLPQAPEPDFLLENGVLRKSILGTPMRIAAMATILKNFAPLIAEVKTPTWILWGRNDNIASIRTAKILDAKLPMARLRVLESSGHDPMSSSPTAVSQFLLDGLATPPGTAVKRVQATPTVPRPGKCDGQTGMKLQGDYTEIEIASCSDVRIEAVRSGSIRIRDSVVVIENAQVKSDAVALDVKNSKVEITASELSGDVAMQTNVGEVDLAGVTLRGKRKSVQVDRSSRLIFSISRLESPVAHRYVHELVELGAGDEL
jgi:pimeloyl-ACP methyl ester carboxylesterase